jgi:hypothetical protein
MAPPGRPFPACTGGCFCGAVRYRLLSAPLFCYACHCADCHKHSGSVFACYTTIEAEFLTSIGSIPPQLHNRTRPNGLIRSSASCPECGTSLWASGEKDPVTVDVRSGTLDHPELMEPDIHGYVESKIPWVILPEGARTSIGKFDFRMEWPKSSLKRFDAALKKYEDKMEEKGMVVVNDEGAVPVAVVNKDVVEEEKETDRTPTAQSPDEQEDDEAFEKRYRETEKALQERLEKLTLKLSEEGKSAEKTEEEGEGKTEVKVEEKGKTQG